MPPNVRAVAGKSIWGFMVLAALAAARACAQAADDEPARDSVKAAIADDHSPRMAEGLELFKNGVRVLLTAHCVKCHGGDETEGELDLTTREGLLRGGSQGPAIAPGRAADSLLYRLVTHAAEPQMPDGAAKLPAESLDLLAKWIDCGAPYDKPLAGGGDSDDIVKRIDPDEREFWSFRPLSPATVPAATREEWCRTPVDRFVLARLEAAGLAPAGPVSRTKLIRRAYLDLIGVPPTPAEVEAFVADPAADAFERLVDRLLDNPHHGERWGRHWLDLARFAESHGYEQDYDRPSAYHYRDFVIKAFNADLPYDEFVRWQIAGDELAPDDHLALMATGFLGAGTHATQITASQVEKERYDELDDMAATIGTAMLGLTIGCARCHDHKFDPLPQYDYYRFVSTFTTTVRSEIELDLQPERYRLAKADFDRVHAPLAEALEAFERDQLPARLEAWLAADARPPAPRWLIVEPKSIAARGGASFTQQADGSYLAAGANPESDEYTIVVETPLAGIVGLRVEALADPSLPHNGPGRGANGNFALSDIRVTAAPLDRPDVPAKDVKIAAAQATFEQAGLPVAATIDDDAKSGWAVDGAIGKSQAAAFALAEPIGDATGTRLTIQLRFATNTGHAIGRPRLAIAVAPQEPALGGEEGGHRQVIDVARILELAAAERTSDDLKTLSQWYRTTDADWNRLRTAVEEHSAEEPQPELTKVMITSEGLPAIRLHTQGDDFFEQTYFLKRGDLNQKLGEAQPGFLQVLTRTDDDNRFRCQSPADARTSFRRASLAQWIADTEYGAGHLLARVIVNRLWQHHLGQGIVATPSDFGSQGARPTHPELLDYLAGELIRNGWRLKPIHRLIMTSAVYQQSADCDRQHATADPENVWFGRWSRRRLEGEAIRDAMLAVSGALDPTPFGPGSLDEAQPRRSIYYTVKRSQLIPMMVLFDAPEPLQSMGLRASTTVAPQALLMMNNPQVRSYAAAFARRLAGEAGDEPAAIVRLGYAYALSRPPGADELSAALEFIAQQTERYRSEEQASAAELALTDYCQALFGLNEFIFVE